MAAAHSLARRPAERADHRVPALRRGGPRGRHHGRRSSSSWLRRRWEFFQQISPVDFFTGTTWSASIKPYDFGVLALISGHAAGRRHRDGHRGPARAARGGPAGRVRESARVRTIIKPILETIAGIPTIVLGFFALYFLTPNILVRSSARTTSASSRRCPPGSWSGSSSRPLIASISEDSMRAVPRGLREGAYAMGATKFEVVRKVVFPAALSGIMASIILADEPGHRRDDGVVLAGGTKPQLHLEPARERPDDDGVHRPDQPRRHAPGLDPVPLAVRGGDDPVR